jgi:RsiW-degrading membrane proteinase PrsW (M82 family)
MDLTGQVLDAHVADGILEEIAKQLLISLVNLISLSRRSGI